jgi:5-oxoprolinase (ATP-hydrolysing)
VTKGCLDEQLTPSRFVDPVRRADPDKFWIGYDLRLLDEAGQVLVSTRVTDFDSRTGRFTTEALMPLGLPAGTRYELQSSDEAPVVAIRYLLGLRLDQPIPDVVVRLGTTRGTNALLTRRGAKVGFVTTKGFRDILLIANQDRPRLFDLAIKKPEPIFANVVEIDERVAADGAVLRSPDPDAVRRQFLEFRSSGIESVAICLLHGFAFPDHELLVERLARDVGFTEVSTSHRLAPLIKIVSRGDTTVLDAYLNPVLRAYVATLRKSLSERRVASAHHATSADNPVGTAHPTSSLITHHSSLKLMTSAGGLVDADRFVGKDSILSGPAGGVIGFSRIAQQAGFTKAIGFDMGGTSTDVSRFDGRYEMEFETKKAGVRVVSPMLSMETVAAGGGSICGFDGLKLTVGPDSAGANPGPACYGRGGPLTITDVNLFLGKIPPERFPFPLQREPVDRHLRRLCDEIAGSPTATKFTPHELAEGFARVANANMVRPIRGISVAKGYDPRDYVLVTFGGAGAQHACAIARELGMRHVLSHPLAGLLSAYGIGLADVRRFAEQAVLKPYSASVVAEIEPLFARLEHQARDGVLADGVAMANIEPPQRSLDLRYVGVEASINVPQPVHGDYLKRYEEMHQQLYGYRHTGRGIEIVNARVEVVGRMPEPPDDAAPLVPRRPHPANRTRTWFDGHEHDTAVFLRDGLHPGDEIAGPAIICEPSSTVVVDPSCTAKVLARGEVLIEVGSNAECGARSAESEVQRTAICRSALHAPHSPDPILLEIFNNLFASIAEQMGITLQNTALSTNVKERLDFSCAIFTPTGDLVVNAPHIPVHLGAMSETVKRIIADNSAGIRTGDVFVTNDPYRGGSHLPDVTVVTPVHDPATGELLFFTASRAHHAEIGGIVPGSMPPFSKCLGDEGVLIRNFKLVDAGRSREGDLRALLESGPHPSRAVKDNLADIAAQVAANHSGVRRLNELVERYSLPVVQAYMKFIQQAAEHKMRRALSAIPDGSYSFTDHLDDGSPIAVTITIAGEEAAVDFTGTGPVLSGNLNANRAIVTAAVLYVFRCLINEDIPLNSGVLAPVRIVLPECLLNPPEHVDPAQCAAIVGGNVETSQRVVDTLLGALGIAAASQGTMNNLTFGDDSFGYYETICGGSGATRDADGADAVHTHMTNTRLTDPEVLERRYPVRLWEFSIRPGSGGAGLRCGGDGVTRRIEFLRPLRLSILSERRGPFPPFGLHDGQPGAFGRNSLRHAAGDAHVDIGGKVQTQVQPGDVLTIETPGGGGFGGG